MTSWLATITGPLGAATKTLQELMEARDLIKFGDTFRKMHSEILAAQASATEGYARELALLEDISALKTRVAEFETWNAEKQRYELKPLGQDGTFAYELKESAAAGEPSHWICPDCYQQRMKSILQQITRSPGMSRIRMCQRCGWEVYVVGYWLPEHGGISASRRTR